MIFVLAENKRTEGTATGFFMSKPLSENITGHLHWVAIKKEYQGIGLSKPLITEAIKVMYKMGHKGSLFTFTNYYVACM